MGGGMSCERKEGGVSWVMQWVQRGNGLYDSRAMPGNVSVAMVSRFKVSRALIVMMIWYTEHVLCMQIVHWYLVVSHVSAQPSSSSCT